ncbi:MAG: hypothetical protein HY897_06590 [Deltaproteobacteria bacterium]|nr:hypothetical protein [Deltaproteobacteria bacterium]
MMQVTATFETDEPLGADPTASIGTIAMAQGPKSGNVYTFTHIAAKADGEGEKLLSVHLQDRAGNTSDLALEQKSTFDFTAPAATLIGVDGGPFRSPKSVPAEPDIVAHIKFTTEEPLDPDPAAGQVKVFVGGTASAGCPSGAATGFDCTFTVPRDLLSGNALEGQKSVTVDLTDAAGNKGSQALGTITFDFTKPTVVNGSEGLQLIPATGNPLPTVKNVTYGTAARISFTASEILFGDPVVALSPATGNWTVTKKNAAGSFYVYDAVLTGGWPDQVRYDVLVTLTDLAGNVSDPVTLALPSAPNPRITVDTVAPNVPDVVTLDKIIYTRVPWGSDATKGIKTFTLRGSSSSVEPNATLIVYDAADVASAAEIGRVTADAAGAFGGDIGSGKEFTLNRADRVNVYISAVDSAGNPSDADLGTAGIQATEVKDVEWTTTMGGKVAGSTFENPNIFESRGFLAQYLDQTGEQNVFELGASSKIDSVGDLAPKIDAVPRWYSKTVVDTPSARSRHKITYDASQGLAILFGGYNASTGYKGDTWAWNGRIWKQVSDTGPSARSVHAMAFSSRKGHAILFGGFDGSPQGDTWEWTGNAWKLVSTAGPSARCSHDLAFDMEPHGRRFRFLDPLPARIILLAMTRFAIEWSSSEAKIPPKSAVEGRVHHVKILGSGMEADGKKFQTPTPLHATNIDPSVRTPCSRTCALSALVTT